MSSEFGNYIKNLRGKKSLRAAAKEMGISHTFLSTLEKGYDPRSKKEIKPTVDTIEKIANYYNVDSAILLEKAGYQSLVNKFEFRPLSDLNDMEIKELMVGIKTNLHEDLQKNRESIKKQLMTLSYSELNSTQINYLMKVISFLLEANKDDLIFMSSLYTQLERYKNSNDNEEDRKVLNEVIIDIQNELEIFLKNYFGLDKED